MLAKQMIFLLKSIKHRCFVLLFPEGVVIAQNSQHFAPSALMLTSSPKINLQSISSFGNIRLLLHKQTKCEINK